ncbi:hypothetical protein D1N74_18675, partial [Clostridioides difficile]
SIEVLLRQLGATRISKVSSTLYFIKFDLGDGWEISYTYNINASTIYSITFLLFFQWMYESILFNKVFGKLTEFKENFCYLNKF